MEYTTPRHRYSITRGSTPHTCDSPGHNLTGTNPPAPETAAWISAANPFTGPFPRSPPDSDVFRASTLYWCIIAWTNVLVKKIISSFCFLLEYTYWKNRLDGRSPEWYNGRNTKLEASSTPAARKIPSVATRRPHRHHDEPEDPGRSAGMPFLIIWP